MVTFIIWPLHGHGGVTVATILPFSFLKEQHKITGSLVALPEKWLICETKGEKQSELNNWSVWGKCRGNG